MKAFVHPANEHDGWGGQALLLGMDLPASRRKKRISLWPRVRKVFVDWGYRGLREVARGLGVELEVVARPHAGVREGEEVPEILREGRFKPLPKRWVVERTFPTAGERLRVPS